jgi:hypothetical protein
MVMLYDLDRGIYPDLRQSNITTLAWQSISRETA